MSSNQYASILLQNSQPTDNLRPNTIRTLLSKDELGGDIYIRELAFYSDDELWIGTESGLYIYNLHTAKIIHLQNVNGDPYSISDNAIYSILKDREGGMWIGTYFGGVNYYPRQYTYFDKVYPQKESNKMGKRVREFCAAHDGTLWIGTDNLRPNTIREHYDKYPDE